MVVKKVKGLIFISNVQKALEHEWFCEFVDKKEMDLEFVLFNSKESDLYNFIVAQGFKCNNYSLGSKFFIPFYIFVFYFKLLFTKYNLVHCHLFEASLIGLISAKFAGVEKRIHTRHHADFHHTYFPNAVKYDLLINKYSTHIIAVSNNIKVILTEREDVSPQKITVIPHGIPSSVLNKHIPESDIELAKKKYGFGPNSPVIGVVSRFTEWKGIQYIIPAFKQFVQDHKNAKLVLANAHGDYDAEIKKLLKELSEESYVLIPFENNMLPLFKSFDMFVHTPIDIYCEAFGQVYIEALGLNVPMICTISGIANDFIENRQNALVVRYKSTEDIYSAMRELMSDHDLKNKIVSGGHSSVQSFSFEAKFNKLKQLYLS
ncbi:MAG: glycosyltransferase family 4 protein [Bacteroidota bacterium]